jgi:hypothetical protein
LIKCSIEKGGALLWFYGPRGLLKPVEEPAWPYLDSISDIQDVARGTGQGGLTDSEVSSMNLTLHNAQHLAYELIGIPLRAPCVVYFNDTEIFSGVIADVELGIAMRLGIES